MKKIYYLNCSKNQITNLTFKNNRNLAILVCNKNKIKVLDLSLLNVYKVKYDKSVQVIPIMYIGKDKGDRDELIKIIKDQRKKGVRISTNFNNPRYEWSKKTKRLIGVDWSGLKIKGKLDLNKLDNLTDINVKDNRITKLYVNKLNKLETIDCSRNKIRSMSIKGLKKLGSINCSYNKIKKLKLVKLVNLHSLDCSDNQIRQLNLNSLHNLSECYCSNNKLEKLNIRKLKKLQYALICSNNNLNELVIGAVDLDYLDCRNNKILKIYMRGIFELDCDENVETIFW